MNEQELIEVIEKSDVSTEAKAELIEILELYLDSIFEGVKRNRTVQIEVKGGTVVEVSNLPEGCNYKVIDHDLTEDGE